MTDTPVTDAFGGLCEAASDLRKAGGEDAAIAAIHATLLDLASRHPDAVRRSLRPAARAGSPALLRAVTWQRGLVVDWSDLSRFLDWAGTDDLRLLLSFRPVFGDSLPHLARKLLGRPAEEAMILDHVRSHEIFIPDFGPGLVDVNALAVFDREEDARGYAELLTAAVARQPDLAARDLWAAAHSDQDDHLVALVLAGARPCETLPGSEEEGSLAARARTAHGRLSIRREHGPLSRFLAETIPF